MVKASAPWGAHVEGHKRPEAGRSAHLEFVHDLADGFAAGTDDAGVDTVVQRDVLRNHLFEFTHDFQNGVPGGFRVLLVPCDGDLVLGLRRENPVRRTMPRRAEQGGGKAQQAADSQEQVSDPSATPRLLIPPQTSPKRHLQERRHLPAKVTRHWQVRARAPRLERSLLETEPPGRSCLTRGGHGPPHLPHTTPRPGLGPASY